MTAPGALAGGPPRRARPAGGSRSGPVPAAPFVAGPGVVAAILGTLPLLALLAGPAAAQGLPSEPLAGDALAAALGEGSLAGRTIQILVLVTALSVLPGLAVTVTCFPFVVTVLSILRQGIGLQAAPPAMLIVALSVFLTWFVMDPVFAEAWSAGVRPFLDGTLPLDRAAGATLAPFQAFMAGRVAPGTLATLAELRPGLDPGVAPADAPLSVLIPSFLLSEVSRAFQVGFLVLLPFLVIDLVVSAVLMSMGMMMVPPAVVALPFKLAFFVVADGWSLVAASLVRSYG